MTVKAKVGLFVLIVLVVVLVAAGAASGGHAQWYKVGAYEMNEAHRPVLRDATGNGLVGTIGDKVALTGAAHKYSLIPNDVFRPEHVDRIPNYSQLDPNSGDYQIAVRFLWSGGNDRNLIQQGQGSPAGGMWKIKTTVPAAGQPAGYLKCLFRGSLGDSQTESYSAPRSDDGRWHVLKCSRTNNGTSMVLDGVLVDTNDKQPGAIANDWPITVGGNGPCAETTCNYWAGRIGWVRIFKA